MGRASTEVNKNIYWQSREAAGFTREAASEALEFISANRIDNIEHERGKAKPNPEEVVKMAEVYKDHTLCNYYCSQECAVGQIYVPKINMESLYQIAVKLVATINSLGEETDRFLEIIADGKVEDKELREFATFQNKLEEISIAVETLQLWSESTEALDVIDTDKLAAMRESLKE